MPVAFCPAVPGNITILHALPDLSVKPYIVVGTGPDIFAGIVPAVCFRPASGANVMDHDVFDSAGVAQSVKIVRSQQFVNLHRRSPPFRPGPSHPGEWLPGNLAALFPMLP